LRSSKAPETWRFTSIASFPTSGLPAIDLQKSGTPKGRALIPKKDLDRIWVLRRVHQPALEREQMELVLERLDKSKNNAEFLSSMNQ
jgi:transcription termination factor Rho